MSEVKCFFEMRVHFGAMSLKLLTKQSDFLLKRVDFLRSLQQIIITQIGHKVKSIFFYSFIVVSNSKKVIH